MPGCCCTQRRCRAMWPDNGSGGELGPEARRFVDFLATAGFGIWQVLALGPPYRGLSPYYCLSSYAGNPALISGHDLVDWGWLNAEQLVVSGMDKAALLRLAREGFGHRADDREREEFVGFVSGHRAWLDDYALFIALFDEQQCRPWGEWPLELRHRDPSALHEARAFGAGHGGGSFRAIRILPSVAVPAQLRQ